MIRFGDFQLMFMFVFLAVVLIPAIFYFITLQNALKAVEPDNRNMAPANVWLLLIPFFNFIWMFFVVNAIGKSFKKQYEKYGIIKNSKPSYAIGLATSILMLCTYLPLVNLALLVCWIIHWVQVTRFKNELLRLKETFQADGQSTIFG